MSNSKIYDGGPAFPRVADSFGPGVPGMSLRDWFAGQALAGMLANPDWSANNTSKPDNGSSIPEIAFEVADAMIAARENGGAQ